MARLERRSGRRAHPQCGVVAALLLSQMLPSWAGDAPVPAEAPTVVRVLAVYSILASETTPVNNCRPVLVSERELLQRERDRQPWGLKYAKPLAGIGLGVASAIFYQDHMQDVLDPRWVNWKMPFAAANAVEGYVLGPGPAIGGWAGAELGVMFSSGNLLVALGGNVIGSLLGGMAWKALFPPIPALAPLSDDPDGAIPVEHFLRDSVCAPAPTRRFEAPQYRVEFKIDDVLQFTDLAYDPGEALSIAADGTILGPARGRLEE